MTTLQKKLARLIAVLDTQSELAIAVSGGLDSMVLAHVAHARARTIMTAVHAVSPAVPRHATERVQAHAARHGWNLLLVEPQELDDPNYRSNPVDRCFYCKSRLYRRIQAHTGLRIASGTNIDDLSDYRPGLDAAARHEVLHPYVDAGLSKADIYEIARQFGLHDLAALPAQPCLASRIETGIRVDASALHFIEAAETALDDLLPGAGAIRCRITAEGVFVECEKLPTGDDKSLVERQLQTLCAEKNRHFAGMRLYRRGAAFLRVTA